MTTAVTAGAVSGVASGQAAQATENVLNGQSITEGLGNPGDMVQDALLGGAAAAAGYGVGKIVQSLGRSSTGSSNLMGGETPATIRGKAAHLNYPNTLGSSYDYRVRLPSGLRPDAVDWQNHIVRELKPNNQRAIQRGWTQVRKYLAELAEDGNPWTAYVDTY